MSTLCIHVEKEETASARFRAVAGNRQSVGQTVGEAIDALLADWEIPIEQAEVFIEEPENTLSVSQYEEPHLIQVNGLWVIAGGQPMPLTLDIHDFVAEMYEERERSFMGRQTENIN